MADRSTTDPALPAATARWRKRQTVGPPRPTWRFAAALMAGWLAFLWPTLVNGNAFLLADTSAYMRGADAMVSEISGLTTAWSTDKSQYLPSTPPATSGTEMSATTEAPRVVLAGRSVYYGLLLYATAALGGFLAMAVLQSTLCVICATLIIVQFGRSTRRSINPQMLALVLVGTGLATSVGYFSAYMVPDIFAALAALALAALVAFSRELPRREKIFWWLLLVAALGFHSANLLIFALVAAVTALTFLINGRIRQFPAALLLSALILGVLSEIFFSTGVRAITGQAPIRPPFIAARLIDDGPGRAYLRERCAGSTLLLCEWRDRIPRGSDTILWGTSPTMASFTMASSADKRRLAREEHSFILAVIADRPLDVLRGSLATIWAQASQWSLGEFNYSATERAFYKVKLPQPFLADISATRAWKEAMPVAAPTWLIRIGFAIALAMAIAAIVGRGPKLPPPVRQFIVLLLVAIACDIVVTGALSTPHGRYLMRMTWILPFALLGLASVLRFGRRHSPSDVADDLMVDE